MVDAVGIAIDNEDDDEEGVGDEDVEFEAPELALDIRPVAVSDVEDMTLLPSGLLVESFVVELPLVSPALGPPKIPS